MKKIFTLLLGGASMLLTVQLSAQLTNARIANFGIDGDVLSNFSRGFFWSSQGTHDWFPNTNSNVLGVIDTTGATAVTSILSSGENYVFDRGMSVPRYSVQDGYVVLDARYARDYFGISAGSGGDLTAFTSGSKNGMDPTSFVTAPGGTSVSNKCDIIDAYVHMRRDGSVVNGAASSHLTAMMAASTVTNNGDRFFDVEYYWSAISYDATTGTFSNSGPASTGGHTAWVFNTDGSIKSFGDMDMAFSFSGASMDDLSVWIWVSKSDLNIITPQGFDFVQADFIGASNKAQYGYVRIQPKSGSSMRVWGSVCGGESTGPVWGTCSGTLGSTSNNYYYSNYDEGQMGEAAIDLTALGIDPALVNGQNSCDPPSRELW